MKLNAADEPSETKAKIHAATSTGNEAMKGNLRNLTTPMIKREIAATKGND